MRRAPTPAEGMLWRAVRARQIAALKFRRQVPIGPFIADLYCPAARLVVEIDGETHANPAVDAGRTAWLMAQGIRVLRFRNDEVLGNLEGVLVCLQGAVAAPPPLAGGGRGEGTGGDERRRLGRKGTRGDSERRPPPPNPLPQGEGESAPPPIAP